MKTSIDGMSKSRNYERNNMDNDLIHITKELRLKNKIYFFDVKENSNGKFLKITEISKGRSNIIIPEEGWKEFCEKVNEIIKEKSD